MYQGQTDQDGEVRHSSASAFEIRHQRLGAHAGVIGGFTRRCGRRAPADKRPCMYLFGHVGRHEWDPSGPDAAA
jgi:hypothetical protein